jgi:hypothetical protein
MSKKVEIAEEKVERIKKNVRDKGKARTTTLILKMLLR